MNLTELKNKLLIIKNMGWIETHRNGDTGIGKTLEDLLGIDENNLSVADLGFLGELKSYRVDSDSHLTLFTTEPVLHCPKVSDFLKNYGYLDKKGRLALKNRLHHNKPNSQSMFLTIDNINQHLKIMINNNSIVKELGFYELNNLKMKFESKLKNSVILVGAKSEKNEDGEKFLFEKADMYINLSFDNFLKAVENGTISLEFRMHLNSDGSVRNRGTGFRIHRNNLEELYERSYIIL